MIIEQEVRLYKLDKDGYFMDYERMKLEIDTNTMKIINVPKGYIEYSWTQQNPSQRWYTPKYDFELGRWVESLTNEEIEEYNKPVEEDLNLTTDKKEIIELKKQLEETQQGLVEIMNLISIQE